MKTELVTVMLLNATVLLILSGCGASMTQTLANGDFVKNAGGHGTGRIAGIRIEVIQAAGREASASQMEESSVPAGESKVTHDIRLGNVRIVMVEADGKTSLSVNGKNYGEVSTGDSLVVDADRIVSINGKQRQEEKTTASDGN